MVKVQRGTRSTERLCDTCAMGVVMRGSAESDEATYCGVLEKNLTMCVVECSAYNKRGEVSLYDMRETAWILETKKVGKDIGFKPARQWAKEHDDEELIPSKPGFGF